MQNTSTSFQSILTSFGYRTMKIWATEYGAPTNGPGASSDLSDYNLDADPDHVTETLQAQMATDSVRLAKTSSMLGALFWYTQTDTGTDTSDRENFFGLRRFDGSAKPAYGALQKAIAAARS